MADKASGADFRYYDEAIRTQADIIASLLTVSTKNNNDAKKAIDALETLRAKLSQDVSAMTDNVKVTIAQSADGTATRAAELLQKRFLHADAAADAAARRYLQAGRWLGIKTFLILLAGVAVIVLGWWLVASPLLPTFDELQKRRDEIARLTALGENLEKKGVNLDWTYCRDRNNRKIICFRTDGETYTDEKNGASYASPYRAKR